jgi:hypothetical protein
MPWLQFPDPDDTLGDWFKSLYTPWRNSLVDPSIVPLETEIDWDEFWGGMNSTSFLVYEEITEHRNLALGTSPIEFISTNVIRVTYRYISSGKPVVIKQMREFIIRRLHENLSPLPSALTSAGIVQIYLPGIQSRIFRESKSAQEDFWTLEVRVTTKVLNTII